MTSTQDVIQALQMLSAKKDSSYQGGFVQAPQVSSSLQETVPEAKEKDSGHALLCNIIYHTPDNNVTDRDFLVRRVVHTKKDYFLDGMAMDIRAPRLVKVSDIKQIRDMGSGRVYDNAYRFLQDRLGIDVHDEILPEQVSEFGELIKRFHNEITVLMYVVALDGVREKSERMSVLNYVKNHAGDLRFSDEELNDYLISVAPDAESAGMAFQRILRKDRVSIQHFITALINVIMADGRAQDKERIFLAKVMDLLETKGFKFNLSA